MPMTTVADVLDTLTADPGRPRLTWYGPGEERVELSGAVLANWVVKTTNMLTEELDAAPGVVVGLDLPTHWRSLVWALATWRTGAELRLASPRTDLESRFDVVVTTRPQRWESSSAVLVALALPALARNFPDLPPGAIDGAGVLSYGDVLGDVSATDPASLAIGAGPYPGTASVRYEDLFTWADTAGVALEGDRVLLTSDGDCTSRALPADAAGHVHDGAPGPWVPAPGRRSTTLAVLRASLETWLVDGSVVLAGASATERLLADRAALDHLIATERVGA